MLVCLWKYAVSLALLNMSLIFTNVVAASQDEQPIAAKEAASIQYTIMLREARRLLHDILPSEVTQELDALAVCDPEYERHCAYIFDKYISQTLQRSDINHCWQEHSILAAIYCNTRSAMEEMLQYPATAFRLLLGGLNKIYAQEERKGSFYTAFWNKLYSVLCGASYFVKVIFDNRACRDQYRMEIKDLFTQFYRKINDAIDTNFTNAVNKTIPKLAHGRTTELTIDVDDYQAISTNILFVIPQIAYAHMVHNSNFTSVHNWELYLSKILHCAMIRPTNLVIPKLHFNAAAFFAALTTKELFLKNMCDLFTEIMALRKHTMTRIESIPDCIADSIIKAGICWNCSTSLYHYRCKIWITKIFNPNEFLLKDV